jgi:hypothetical protein
MRARPTENCCSFGELFPESFDILLAKFSVREAVEHFDGLTKERKVTKHLVEMHRMCIGLTTTRGPTSLPEKKPKKLHDDLVEVAAANKKDLPPKELKAEVIAAVARIEEMTPTQVEDEQRINTIAALAYSNQWQGLGTVKQLAKQWECSPRTVYRCMDKARERLAEGRGSVQFGVEVSFRKTAQIRDAAVNEKDWRGAIAAQKHLDQITGVLAPQSVQINQQINIATHPIFRQTLDKIFTEIADELEEYPEILERVYQRLQNCLASTKTFAPGDSAMVVSTS